MSAPSHTPGPWNAREQTSRDGKSLGWIIEHEGGRIGWSSFATSAPNQGESPPFPVGAANARLIAAAPDLLEACRRIMGAIAGHSDWHPDPQVDTPDWNEDAHIEVTLTVADCRALKAAIAYAEGRAQ